MNSKLGENPLIGFLLTPTLPPTPGPPRAGKSKKLLFVSFIPPGLHLLTSKEQQERFHNHYFRSECRGSSIQKRQPLVFIMVIGYAFVWFR